MARSPRTRTAALLAVAALALAGGCGDATGTEEDGNQTPVIPSVQEDRTEDGRDNPTGSDAGGGTGVQGDDGSGPADGSSGGSGGGEQPDGATP